MTVHEKVSCALMLLTFLLLAFFPESYVLCVAFACTCLLFGTLVTLHLLYEKESFDDRAKIDEELALLKDRLDALILGQGFKR